MGANEKREATYLGGEYVPGVRDLRNAYVAMRDPDMRLSETRAEFNRAVEKIKVEAKAEALNEAADAMDADMTIRDPLRLKSDWLRNRANQYKEQS